MNGGWREEEGRWEEKVGERMRRPAREGRGDTVAV